ncbi:MAG: type VII toxin-antitoxin system MntA family adenylyltransferase antitoxin [Pseudonocardiaceae bacterium]
MTPEELASSLRGDPALRGIRLLVLHGSRARGEAGARSDWDLGYLADPGADLGALAVVITSTVRSDGVDLVDLATASALLRYRTARDGVLLLEREPDTFLGFRLEATRFWCDVEPIVRAAHDDVLGALA